MAKKVTGKQLVRCLDCKHATYFQRKGNPIISVCKGERDVARTLRTCDRYEERGTEATIEIIQ